MQFCDELASSLEKGVVPSVPSSMKTYATSDMFDMAYMKVEYVNYLVARVSCQNGVRLENVAPNLLPSLLKTQAEYFVLWVSGKPVSLFAIIPSSSQSIIIMPDGYLQHYLKSYYYTAGTRM